MSGEARRRNTVRAAVVVAAATLLALALPSGAPLYAEVYPGENPGNVREALVNANVDSGFDASEVTQFETTTFRATVIYGTSINPELPTVKIAWSNEAVLSAQDEGTFDIEPTSLSRLYLDAGTRRPEGGYGLTWTWDVTPLVSGEQTLILSILPTVVIEGSRLSKVADINEPIAVDVSVHPVQNAVDEVLAAAKSMKTEVPDAMIVGEDYPISASMSLAGHGDTVSADIGLAQGKDSAAVTIVDEPAAAGPAAHVTTASSEDERVVRRWTVTPDEPGQVALVFTATVQGEANARELRDVVPVEESARAMERGPSFWEVLQQPVLYLTPFVALAAGVLGLWAAWRKRRAGEPSLDEAGDSADSGPAPGGRSRLGRPGHRRGPG